MEISMKNLFYTIAKSIVEKHDKTEKQKEEKDKEAFKKIMEARKAHNEFITVLSKRFIEEAMIEFKKNNEPKFSIGEIVVTNWYGPGDSWEGSVQSLQSHTPCSGPIDVQITKVILDSSELSELINELNNRDIFSDIHEEIAYNNFKNLVISRTSGVNGKTYMSRISWAYEIKVPGDENVYWKYSWRESKFLNSKSSEAKLSKKAYKNQLESERLYQERKVLEEKIKEQIENANHIKVIIR
jgi:hypothetical protein